MLRTLGNLYCQEGRFKEASALATEAVKTASSEPQSLRYAFAVNMLADAYYGEGRYADAEPLYSDSAAMFLGEIGDTHVYYEQTLGSLGLTFAKEGKVQSARDSFRKAYAVNINAWHAATQSGSESLRFLRNQSDRYVRGYLELLAAIARHPEMDPRGAPPQPEAFVVAEQSRRGITDSRTSQGCCAACGRRPRRWRGCRRSPATQRKARRHCDAAIDANGSFEKRPAGRS